MCTKSPYGKISIYTRYLKFVSPELRERHGRVEAGEDGDGAELCGVPHELGLVVHSDNLAGVYLDKTAMNGKLLLPLSFEYSVDSTAQRMYKSNLS